MKIVLFDIDETLLSVPKGVNSRTSAVMFKKVFGIEASEDIIENHGKTEKAIIPEVLEKIRVAYGNKEQEPASLETAEEAYRTWAVAEEQELIENPPKVLAGITELLTQLSNNPDVKLALLTGNSSFRAKAKLKAAGMQDYFKDENGNLRGVFGEMALKREDLAPLAKKKLANTNDVLVVIDDSLLGAMMAKKYNIASVLVGTGKTSVEGLKEFSPYVFPDFGENRWQKAAEIISNL